MNASPRARIGSLLGTERGQRLLAWGAFFFAAVVSIVLIGYAGRGQTLKGDEWGYAFRLATEPLLDAIFDPPPGKYLLVLPMLFYKAAFGTIGIGDYLPYRLAGMALTVAAAALFLVLAARRVGYVAALSGAVLVLFLGSSSEITVTPIRIPTQIAVVAGLGMLLVLERRDLRGDLAACALLLVSITSHPLGTAFAAAATVLVLARPAPERWRRAWVFIAPVLLFAAWYATLREPALESVPLGEQLEDLPRFVAQSLATMAASASGVFRSPFNGDVDYLTPLAYVLGAAIVVTVAFRAFTTRLPASFWAILAAVLVLFAAPAFAPGELRVPDAPRYVLPGVIMLLLLLCESLRGVSLGSPAARAAAAGGLALVFGFAFYSNAIRLEQRARFWGADGKQVRAELAAVDLAGERIDPAFRSDAPLTYAGITPGQYLTISGEYGSAAFSAGQLRSQPAALREIADATLAPALDLHLTRIPSLPSRGPRPLVTAGKARRSGPGCVTLLRSDGPTDAIRLPPGGVALAAAPGQALNLALARFGAEYTYPLEPLRPGEPWSLRIPPDADPAPWRMLVRPVRQHVTLCGLT
jgi:hypothetical protein